MEINEELNAMQEAAEAAAEEDVELTAEELPQVAGGNSELFTSNCPYCGTALKWTGRFIDRDFWKCPNCGELTFIWDGARWLKGIVRFP